MLTGVTAPLMGGAAAAAWISAGAAMVGMVEKVSGRMGVPTASLSRLQTQVEASAPSHHRIHSTCFE